VNPALQRLRTTLFLASGEGWVERSETHHWRLVGLAALDPPYFSLECGDSSPLSVEEQGPQAGAAERQKAAMNRRTPKWGRLLIVVAGILFSAALAGCDTDQSIGHLVAVWGHRGISAGRLQKPRAMAIDAQDRLYLVDMTARIQVFTTSGQFLHGWQTPVHEAGKPTGLSIGRDGNVLVADTHYYRLLIYSPEGKLLQTIGGTQGPAPGEFGLVTDAVQDRQGNYYISEYGEYDRIQKFTPEGRFLREWGGHGSEPGQFMRPQGLALDEEDHVWVADAGNHRIQVFDGEGTLLQCWGTSGSGPGELYYPYSLALAPGDTLYVCEYGNHRVQKFTRDGRSLGCWGTHGRGEGQLHNPWALVRDSRGRIYVLDTNNHRVQVVDM
jgi:DNA-binding beta-propeller fold protein YncE